MPLCPLLPAALLAAAAPLQVPAAPGGPRPSGTPPYDFAEATALLDAAVPSLGGDVAVIVEQRGRELFRYQAGAIDFDTRTRLASFSKTVSAGVILDLVEEGALSLDERLGDVYPLLFEATGLGDPTVLDCWAMRHGIDTPLEFHHSPTYTLPESVFMIGVFGFLEFQPGERLGYDGAGMQVTGRIATERSGRTWDELASERVFEPLGMGTSDYLQFTPNSAVPAGLRSTALDSMRYARMLMNEGVFEGSRLLEPTSIERLFTNHTRDLPIEFTPFPASHPDYPYGVDPDYAFGGWVLAENPATLHVEEVLGAGAWGSFLWLDRRRALTAVLIADVPVGTQHALDAALGVFRVAREAVEAEQVQGLVARASGGAVTLDWRAPASARTVRVFGSNEPIRDVFDLRAAERLGVSSSGHLTVPVHAYYAATAVFEGLHNEALVPDENSISGF